MPTADGQHAAEPAQPTSNAPPPSVHWALPVDTISYTANFCHFCRAKL